MVVELTKKYPNPFDKSKITILRRQKPRIHAKTLTMKSPNKVRTFWTSKTFQGI